MNKLPADQYPLVLPLFNPLEFHLAIRNVLAGKTAASIFVDDLKNPHLALAWTRKRVYLAGKIPDEGSTARIQGLIVNEIYPQVKAAGLPVLVFYYAPDVWKDALRGMFSAKALVLADRQHYTHQALPSDWRDRIPEGIRLHTVDADFLRRSDLDHIGLVLEEIQSEGEPLERFAEDRLGVCAISGDEIVGWCLSEYNLGDRCEIGIETLEPYQRRGLGTAMTCALIELANTRGITHVGWDCYRDNLPSVATARRAGFSLDHEYESLVCWL